MLKVTYNKHFELQITSFSIKLFWNQKFVTRGELYGNN